MPGYYLRPGAGARLHQFVVGAIPIIAFLINTPSGRHCRPFEVSIRATAVRLGVPLVTTLSGAAAVVLGLEEMARGRLDVRSLQDYQRDLAAATR